jgi:peroxiredoxin
MSLKEQLDARKAEFLQKRPPEVVALMQKNVDALKQTGIADGAVQSGELAPDFDLPDAWGRPVRLSKRLSHGPVVLTFYRGGWCPYCNIQLRAYQQALPELRKHGASLIAISPETPDHSLSTAEKNALTFDVLSDRGNRVAQSYGIVYPLSGELRELYTKFGHPLPDTNGDDSWTLPIPATFVIDTLQRITLVFVDPEYRNRLEPDAIFAALSQHHAAT